MVTLVNVQIFHVVEIYYLTQRIQIDYSIFYIFNRSKEFNKFLFYFTVNSKCVTCGFNLHFSHCLSLIEL